MDNRDLSRKVRTL